MFKRDNINCGNCCVQLNFVIIILVLRFDGIYGVLLRPVYKGVSVKLPGFTTPPWWVPDNWDILVVPQLQGRHAVGE